MAEENKTSETTKSEETAAADKTAQAPVKLTQKRSFRLLIGALVLVLLIGGGFYYWESSQFVSTDDAVVSIATPTISITVPFGGRLTSWKVKTNDQVNQGEVLGEESNQSVLAENQTIAPMVTNNPVLAQRLTEMEKIRSPISGVLIQSNAAVGQGVQPGQVLAQVVNQDHIQVTANIFETDIRRVHLGQTVTMTVDGLPGLTLQGKVVRIANNTESVFSLVPNVTAASGTYTKVAQRIPVYIDFKDPGLAKQTLVPGMSVVVKIHVG
jgi:multidrug resistance efflux pump